MTRLFDDPANFTEDMLRGFLDAHQRHVTGVPGGVVRATRTPAGKVAVVIGGGSGHYPAFCGVVGPGLADGAVVGNIFTSPSADDAYSVAKAAENGGGVLFSYGNYAGDVIHFGQAEERLRHEGIDARTVLVTDDIASAPASEMALRRGIAGDFAVFKIAGAAAEERYTLDEVERVARKTNERTRTLGVAFGGCTLPGADAPLFTVPEGKMGVGLGIHGEPGVSEDTMASALELARRLADGVLAELPDDTERVAAILNGLGATKYEELFVLWGAIAPLLHDRGLTVIDPEVGELVTSLDMAGCSLTLVALDEELERLWRAPADSPAYRKAPGDLQPSGSRRRSQPAETTTQVRGPVSASEASRACAATALAGLEAMAVAIVDAEDELGRLDAVAGDGDHGRGMVRGITAAVDAARGAAEAGQGVASLLRVAGDAWAAKAGGTSGALWGAALSAFGARLGDDAVETSPTDVVAAATEAREAIQRLGRAHVGDKTMLDALEPFIVELGRQLDAGGALADAWEHAADVATEAASSTAGMRPRVGRARPLADRSVGTPDPGAVSLALSLRAVIEVLHRG